jgi:hypothetical protein
MNKREKYLNEDVSSKLEMDASEQMILHLSVAIHFFIIIGSIGSPPFYNSLNGEERSAAGQRESGPELDGALLEGGPKEVHSCCRPHCSVTKGRGHVDPRWLSHVTLENAQIKNDIQTLRQA